MSISPRNTTTGRCDLSAEESLDGCGLNNPDQITKVLQRRPTAAAADTDFASVGGSYCADRDPAPVGDVDGEIRRLMAELKPPPPALAISPPKGSDTLVNLPNILATAEQPPITRDVFAAGVPVTITARPTRWRWYADGALVHDVTYPGLPYNKVDTPQSDPDLYLTHAFTTTGAHTYELRATWTATAAFTGTRAPIPVIETITTTGTQAITALEARARLVNPDGDTTPDW